MAQAPVDLGWANFYPAPKRLSEEEELEALEEEQMELLERNRVGDQTATVRLREVQERLMVLGEQA